MNNTTRQEYASIDELLKSHGSSWILDNFNLYPFLIFSPIGLILNLFSLIIFMDSEFDTQPLYQYLRVYVANNVLMCFIGLFNFTFTTFRIFSWSNAYWTQAYCSYFKVTVGNLSYFYSTVLDIVILVDRISNFKRKWRSLFVLDPYQMCAVCLLACLVFNIPIYLAFSPSSATSPIGPNETFTVWFVDVTPFQMSKVGTILLFIVNFTRDLVTMLIEIVLNIISVVLLKNYLSKKRRLTIPSENTVTKIEMRRPTIFVRSTRRVTPADPLAVLRLKSTEQISSTDTKATMLVIIMSALTFAEHMLVLGSLFYNTFNFNLTVYVLYAVSNFFWVFKRSFQFFLFYKFNKKFRTVCFKYLKWGPISS